MLKFIDDLAYRLLARLGAWLCGHKVLPIGIAAFIYAFGGLALPIALGWSTPALAYANFLATMTAVVVLLAWLAAEVDGRFGRHLLEWTTDLRRLDSSEFEWLVAELFTREGWKVRRTGRQDRPDGNIDLDMNKDGRRAIVQCKCWGRWHVGVDAVRAFAGTLKREGLLREGDGFFVTLSQFTDQAHSEATASGVQLIDGQELLLRLRLQRVRRPEPCPVCGKPMKLGRSEHGWWFRCVEPGCRGKRNLADEPTAVVELLARFP